MARSAKSNILIAHSICWGAAILCALILTYGPHGPARPPKMILISLLPVLIISLATIRAKGGSRRVLAAHAILWATAIIASVLLVNSSLADSVHPIATSVVLSVLGAISLGVLSCATFTESPTVDETIEDLS